MLPKVVLHNAVSADGRMDWIMEQSPSSGGNVDLGLFYELAGCWPVDAMLSGSETFLAAYPLDAAPNEYTLTESPADVHSLLVVVDSRGRIHNWPLIRYSPYWRDAIVLCSHATPPTYLDDLKRQHIDHIIAGEDHVDLRAALEELNARFGVKLIRVDSGGTLNGVLLRAGLVDEVSVVVCPLLIGGTSPQSIFVASDLDSPASVIPLKLMHLEQLRDDVVWLRYEVMKSDE